MLSAPAKPAARVLMFLLVAAIAVNMSFVSWWLWNLPAGVGKFELGVRDCGGLVVLDTRTGNVSVVGNRDWISLGGPPVVK